ncbi:hypothetical protein I317_06699 [Kwoniella heveanensis CBS 569]|uniref:Lysosomal dipeptide transporter MFSD1 n=1 Tax=Kwoniella heveanensis BCC8398 TaxID=1296120 RepID=A0A1B9GME3_9TREE|nr:hypothetical protein I316_06401 [Kwoniella heveanensis BCC8398]OCF39481.1 hypothetical protein I317_06699 [Kwoniella heveanensis CBS 569]
MPTTESTPIASQAADVDEKDRDVIPVLTQNELDGTPAATRYIPLRYRLIAFSMVIFFNTSSSFSESTLSPLKSTFREQLGVTNAQYGAISSASSLVNTILPVIGGLGIDYWGATYAAIICSTFIMIGAIISAAGSNTSHFGMVVGGRVLMGFGSMVIESAQLKLYSHWFRGSNLALVIGLDLAWSRVLSVISRSTAVPMSMINGWWGWALWIPAFTTVANLIICVMYWYFERRVPEKYRPPLGKDAAKKEGALRKVIEFNNLPKLPRFFWLFVGIQIFQTSVVGVYSSNLADIQTQTRGTSKLAAGYNSSLQSVAPIVLIPLVGAFIDRFGMRMFFISWTAMMYVIVIGLIGLTKVHPLGPIILGSFALSTYALPFSASIPIMIGDPRLLGTAIGVWKAFGNGGIIVFDVAAGAIQDLSGNNSYNNVIYLLMVYKSLQILYGFFFDWLDGRWLAHSLRKGEKERTEIRDRSIAEGVVLPGWKPSKWGMYIVMGELAGLTITAWAVYIVYSLGK